MLLELVHDAPLLELVYLDDRGEELEVVPSVRGQLLQRERVLREAAAAVADAGTQEVWPEPVVEPDSLGDLDHVGAERLADIRDLVDKADPRHEEGVRGELDHLRRGNVRMDDRSLQGPVQSRHRLAVIPGEGADHHAVRMREVVHGRSFREELRVRDVADVGQPACVECARGPFRLCQPGRCSS